MTLTHELLSTNRPPTQSEREEAQERLSKLNQEIYAFDADLDDLAYRWNRLHDQREAVYKVAMAHYMVLSPFRTLPDDIIREICIACAGLDGHRMSPGHMPLLLTQISRRFRDVALTTPEVWRSAHIDLTKPRLHAELIPVARRWMTKYSGALPLSICLKVVRHSSLAAEYLKLAEEIIDIIMACCARWQSVDLTCSNELLRRIAALTPTNVPLLRSLTIYFPDNDSSALHSTQILRLPTLNTVSIMGFDFHVVQCPLIGVRVTSLTLGSNRQNNRGTASVQNIMHILQNCPLLITCHISVNYVGDDANSDINFGEVHLDFLKFLTLEEVNSNWNDEQGKSIITGVHAPSLESLHLITIPEDEFIKSFLSRSPKIKLLELLGSVSETSLVAWLSHCPQLARLDIGGVHQGLSDQLFSSLVAENARERVCPELDHFIVGYFIRITTFECLNKFLSYKDGSVPGLKKWRFISFSIELDDSVMDKEATEVLISSLREAGVDVNVTMNYRYWTPPESVASN